MDRQKPGIASLFGRVAAGLAMLALWALLADRFDRAVVVSGLAVAAAIAVWAGLADL